MKYWLLKFNYGVEIGARLAYLGHYARTKDPRILEIADEELKHRAAVFAMLRQSGRWPSITICAFFLVVGNVIKALCAISPLFLLDFIARTMEVFAVANYEYLARLLPEFESVLLPMAAAEKVHQQYFSRPK